MGSKRRSGALTECMLRGIEGRNETISLPAACRAALGACGDRTASTSDDRFRLERNTEFDGAKLRVFVTLNDGSEASVNTADHVIGAGPD